MKKSFLFILFSIFVTTTCYVFVWIAGSSTTTAKYPVYGEKGVPDPDNHPGARLRPCYTTDSLGNFYLFGGQGYKTTGGSIGNISIRFG